MPAQPITFGPISRYGLVGLSGESLTFRAEDVLQALQKIVQILRLYAEVNRAIDTLLLHFLYLFMEVSP